MRSGIEYPEMSREAMRRPKDAGCQVFGVGTDGTQAHGTSLESLLPAITPPSWNFDEEEGYGRGSFWGSAAAFPFYRQMRGLYHGLAMASGRLGRKILHLVMVAGASLPAWVGHNDGVWRVGLVIAFLGIGSGFFGLPWRLRRRDTTRWSCKIRGARGA